MDLLLAFATIIAPIILAVVEMIKKTVSMPNNFVPLLAFIVGLIIAALAIPFTDLDIVNRLWAGGLAGLSATGLFELIKTRDGQTKEGN